MTTDPVTTYLQTFEALRAGKRWSEDTTVLRFVALTLASTGLDDPHAALTRAARTLRARAGWTSPLRSNLRYAVAAMILRRGLDPARVHERVVETRDALRSYRLPRRTGATLAALVLVLHEEGRPVPRRHLDRLADIYRRWRDDHFWLTGADDLPTAAIHAMRDEPVEQLGLEVERAYRQLHQAGFSRGNALQLVSQLLAVDPRGAQAGVGRFRRIADALRRRGERVGRSRYDEIAVLCLTRAEPTPLVARLLRNRDLLRAEKPRPSKEIAISLAAGLVLAEDAEKQVEQGIGDLAMIRSLQAILDAQQAAMVAAIVASSAAASAAAGS